MATDKGKCLGSLFMCFSGNRDQVVLREAEKSIYNEKPLKIQITSYLKQLFHNFVLKKPVWYIGKS